MAAEKSMQEERRDADATALILLPDVNATSLIHLVDLADELLGEKDEKVYPPPLHSHEEVVRDRQLFMESLRNFHSSMNTEFMLPEIGGTTVDLHLLYTEVTRRGGLEKVTAEKKWKDVVAAFEFPPTETTASFVMGRYYLSLLYHYEQVYFFHSDGPLISPSAAVLSEKNVPPKRLHRSSRMQKGKGKKDHSLNVVSDSRIQKGKAKKGDLPNSSHQNGDPNCLPASGTIDAEFEYGYIVRMKIGDENLCGMVYRMDHIERVPYNSSTVATTAATAAAALPPPVLAAPEMSSSDGGGGSSHKTFAGQINWQKKPRLEQARLQRSKRDHDPSRPKLKRSAYNFFFVEKQAMLHAMYPGKGREFCKIIGESWKNLTPEEKMVYENQALEDMSRYNKEMLEYKRKLELGHLPKE